jgi:hypothetical protein
MLAQQLHHRIRLLARQLPAVTAASEPNPRATPVSISSAITACHNGYSGADAPAPRNAPAAPDAKYLPNAATPAAFTSANRRPDSGATPARYTGTPPCIPPQCQHRNFLKRQLRPFQRVVGQSLVACSAASGTTGTIIWYEPR